MANMNILWLIVGCGVLAILYGIWATQSVMSADSGSKRMQEISEAVREGGAAWRSAGIAQSRPPTARAPGKHESGRASESKGLAFSATRAPPHSDLRPMP